MLKQRVLTSVVSVPLLLAAVWFDYPLHWFTVFLVAWGGMAVIEFYLLVRKGSGLRPLLYFGTVWTALVILSQDSAVSEAAQPYVTAAGLPMLLLTAAIVLPLVWLLARRSKTQAFGSWAWTFAGIAYIGVLLGYSVALRGVQDGRNWVYFALLATFASDTTAFFVGRALGRHKLAPSISPSKTWEGAIGGLVGAMAISLLFLPDTLFSAANPLLIHDLDYISAILLGFAVSMFGQLGDLVESLFKRNTGAKDSGHLLPGHGGALDRLDSVVFAGVVVYYFVWLMR
jgi:phosphatidate cytidylyltransferase